MSENDNAVGVYLSPCSSIGGSSTMVLTASGAAELLQLLHDSSSASLIAAGDVPDASYS